MTCVFARAQAIAALGMPVVWEPETDHLDVGALEQLPVVQVRVRDGPLVREGRRLARGGRRDRDQLDFRNHLHGRRMEVRDEATSDDADADSVHDRSLLPILSARCGRARPPSALLGVAP